MWGLVPLLLTGGVAAAYLLGCSRLRRRGDRWPMARTCCMVAGTACVAAAVLPPLGDHDDQFPAHVGQHLLIGMIGPSLLALSGPVTLALRVAPTRTRRALLATVRSLPVAVIASPAVAVVLNAGALYLLYLTRVYAASQSNEVLHAAVHVHMFIAGCLLSWVLIGVDPIRRHSVPTKVATLVVVAAAHDTLSKLLYAHGLPVRGGTIVDRHIGAEIMYYAGTLIDVVLAVVVMTQWWRATGRQLTHTARRTAATES